MSIEKEYDLAVIGGGPGGYVAAIRASQLGMKVVCIEKRDELGGTCLNVGCIPSKTLLHSSFLFDHSKNHINNYGISIKGRVELNLSKMMENKDNTVSKLTKGISSLFSKNEIKQINGVARIKKKGLIEVNKSSIMAKNILIATGSEPIKIPNVEIDEKNIVTSTGALSFKEVPKSLAIIGGGYIGLELGSVWKRLGSEVTVIEFAESIVPTMDVDTAKIFYNTLTKQGIKFLLNTKVEKANILKNNILLDCTDSKFHKSLQVGFDKVLVAVGRRPYTDKLGIEDLNLETNKNGTIKVDNNFQTSINGIYAIGDVIEGPMLAHKASTEGQVFAEKLAGKRPEINYGCIPAVIYTEPEVAWVGPTERELIKKNISYNKGIFPFSANARGKTTGDTQGNIKVLSHIKTDKILAVHIIGAHAGELISEAVTAIEAGMTAEDISMICHAHPTLSESMKEASSLASIGKTLHF